MSARDWYYALFIYKGRVYVGEIDKYNLRNGIYIIEATYSQTGHDDYYVDIYREKWTGLVNAGIPAGYFAESGIPVYHDDD